MKERGILFEGKELGMRHAVEHMQTALLAVRLRVCVLSRFSRVRLFATLWAVAHQAPLSMGFSRQEY